MLVLLRQPQLLAEVVRVLVDRKAGRGRGDPEQDPVWRSEVDREEVIAVDHRRDLYPPFARRAAATLTAKEREVLELMAEGLSNRAIADRLVVTDRAVERDVTSIFGKLGLTATGHGQRRVLAVLAYLKS